MQETNQIKKAGARNMSVNFVLVHYHRSVFPPYIYECIEQIRIFNPSAEIYLGFFPGSNPDYERLNSAKCRLVDIGRIMWSWMHIWFKLRYRGYFTTERYFVIYDIMKKYHLKDVIHIENDVMVYADVGKFMPVLKENYNLAFVRHNDKMCIASFVYIKNVKLLKPLCRFFNRIKLVNDMVDISRYGEQAELHYLPAVVKSYVEQEKMCFLENKRYQEVKQKSIYCENVDKFGCLFDGAAYGQFIGGVHLKLKEHPAGHLNDTCCWTGGEWSIVWETIDQKRIPFYVYGKEKLPLVNLHIHSKELEKYRSDRDTEPEKREKNYE